MKKEYVIVLCLIVLIAGIAGVVLVDHSKNLPQTDVKNQSQTGQYQNISGNIAGGSLSYNIIINAPVPDVPEKITVFKTVIPEVTKDDAIAFAKKFNITDYNEPKEGDSVISVSSKDMRYRVMLYKNGGCVYWDSKRSDTPNGIDIAENLPSDEEAIMMATAFLKKTGLFPDGVIVGGTEHGKVYRSSHGNGSDTVVWEDILVYYTRELDGMKVEGTQFEVEVGGHGDIIRFFSNWKDYQAIGEYQIKTQDSAINTLNQNGISTVSGADKPDNVIINEVYLAYYTTAVAYKEEYLEPVYVFKGEVLKDGAVVKPVKEFVPALVITPDLSGTASPTTIETTATPNLITTTSTRTTSAVSVNETEVSDTKEITTLSTSAIPTETVATDDIEITKTTSPTIIPMESANVTSDVAVNNSTTK